jgi:hypothetical protein
MRKIYTLTLFLSLTMGLSAGDFRWKSQLDTIPSDGFYKILLTPGIIAGANTSYSDIRIFDSKQKEVPYLFREEQPLQTQSAFREYKILENNYLPKQAITRVVLHNERKSIITSLVMVIRNAKVDKIITLKGSDDRKNWYIIQRQYAASSSGYNGKTSEMRVLDFPRSNYEFFEITLNDKRKDPLQIIQVGYYDQETTQGRYSEVPSPAIKQTDSLHKSYITLRFQQVFEISKLELVVSGPQLYQRNISIVHLEKHKKQPSFESSNRFTIASNHPAILQFDKTRASEIILRVDNKDNAPLNFKAVKAYQLNKYLIAQLKAGEHYSLLYGDSKLLQPGYDLQYFTDSIRNTPLIGTGKAQALTATKAPALSLFFNKTFLWIVILAMIILLTWYSVRLLKEMGRNQ